MFIWYLLLKNPYIGSVKAEARTSVTKNWNEKA